MFKLTHVSVIDFSSCIRPVLHVWLDELHSIVICAKMPRDSFADLLFVPGLSESAVRCLVPVLFLAPLFHLQHQNQDLRLIGSELLSHRSHLLESFDQWTPIDRCLSQVLDLFNLSVFSSEIFSNSSLVDTGPSPDSFCSMSQALALPIFISCRS